jgi:hypothetical protein
MRFEIEPFEGAIPIRFGMSEADVARILGDPEHAGVNSSGYRNFTYGGPVMSIGFAKEDRGVNHVAFSAEVEVVFRGLNVFAPGGFDQMCKLDGNPLECFGSIMLLKLGIEFNRFTTEEDAKVVAILPREVVAILDRKHLKPFPIV